MTDSIIGDTVPLGSWPTPLEPAPRLSAAIGLRPDDLWLKRDDLIGLGGGGNKVRKLEWSCAAALRDGATVLVTSGAAQSNHARLTAAAGARLGLPVVLVLNGSGAAPARGNLILDQLFGARLVWVQTDTEEALAACVEDAANELRRDGHRPGVIAFGGSTIRSATAYEAAAQEILDQGPPPDHVVVAVGSGGTMAGLVRRLGASAVLGVHCGAVSDPDQIVTALIDRPPAGLRIRRDQVGAGYAHLTPEVLAAMRLAARSEGIVLDPTYTGRAMAGLLAEVADGHIRPGQRTVFVHTGGLPGLFGHDEIVDVTADDALPL